jgi:hypothetical protein
MVKAFPFKLSKQAAHSLTLDLFSKEALAKGGELSELFVAVCEQS